MTDLEFSHFLRVGEYLSGLEQTVYELHCSTVYDNHLEQLYSAGLKMDSQCFFLLDYCVISVALS